ncbi:ubiquinol-cytochrome C chaperone family protein [Enterovirga sp.]|mgnify:CR=1 FL=1|uniref:ubiquinol-cytochrome C chaperone family protein n=1 Tax=Enterovirga sp. TaxID=2026350 RepID=UPI002B95457E|nr:ubiquinol-cytochrome C chaperone family protein [Enterovirga sp.]HMO30822.1 ubiquinol-cytochrome C chaperone family protein [Enterovirga sp.]
MFGFMRRNPREALILHLHERIVAAARHPGLYGAGGFADTVEGRFEALALHVLLVLRRLRALPAPADDVAQDLVDSVFAHLEAGMRETGVGDMGVPKKMRKLGGAFYDRTAKYEAPFEARDAAALGEELGRRLGRPGGEMRALAAHILAAEDSLARQNLAGILEGPDFPAPAGIFAEAGSRSS